MKRKNWYLFLGISVISLITLSACGGETKNTASSSINTSTTSSISIPNVIGQDYKKLQSCLNLKDSKFLQWKKMLQKFYQIMVGIMQ